MPLKTWPRKDLFSLKCAVLCARSLKDNIQNGLFKHMICWRDVSKARSYDVFQWPFIYSPLCLDMTEELKGFSSSQGITFYFLINSTDYKTNCICSPPLVTKLLGAMYSLVRMWDLWMWLFCTLPDPDLVAVTVTLLLQVASNLLCNKTGRNEYFIQSQLYKREISYI